MRVAKGAKAKAKESGKARREMSPSILTHFTVFQVLSCQTREHSAAVST